MKRWHVYVGGTALFAGVCLLAAVLWWGRGLQPEAGMGQSRPQKVYVVQEIHWRFTSRGSPYELCEGQPGTPMKAFLDQDQASACCSDLNRQRQAKENPFDYQPEETAGTYLDQYATRGEAAFLALVRAEGLVPPVRDPDPFKVLFPEPWVAWWSKLPPDDQRRARLWAALDRVRFYKVVEVALD
jgi:hypothetical protein